MDQQDIDLDSDDTTMMRFVAETIFVRGEAPHIVTLGYTRHGPLLTIDQKRHRAIVVRMVGQEPGTAS